jgi:ABC-type sugar transport system permease subunit
VGGASITALTWKWLFNTQYGPSTRCSRAGHRQVDWLGKAFTNATNLVTNVWLGFPFMMVSRWACSRSV